MKSMIRWPDSSIRIAFDRLAFFGLTCQCGTFESSPHAGANSPAKPRASLTNGADDVRAA
jgi:hypothetical protein